MVSHPFINKVGDENGCTETTPISYSILYYFRWFSKGLAEFFTKYFCGMKFSQSLQSSSARFIWLRIMIRIFDKQAQPREDVRKAFFFLFPKMLKHINMRAAADVRSEEMFSSFVILFAFIFITSFHFVEPFCFWLNILYHDHT